MPKKIDLSDEEIVAALRQNYWIVGSAARSLHVSPHTLQRRIASNAVLRQARQEHEADFHERALATLIRAALAGHMPSVKWFLERFAADRGYGTSRARLRAMEEARRHELAQSFLAFVKQHRRLKDET